MAGNSQGRNVVVQGRIVWVAGDLYKGAPALDMTTKVRRVNRQGEPMTEYAFGLAVPKAVLSQSGKGQPGEIWAAMHEEARQIYPNGLPPSFSMKYKDGDGIDHNGKPFADRVGHKDCMILSLKTTIPPKFFRFENGNNVMVSEGIKCGDYVNVAVSVTAHPGQGTSKPGLYLNPNAVQLVGIGEEIVNTPSGDTLFGTMAPAVPAGAQAPGSFMQSAPPAFMGGQQAPAVPAFQQQPQQAYQPPMAPQAPQPYHGVLPPQHQPQGAPPMGNAYAPPAMPPQQGFAPPQPPPTGQMNYGQTAPTPAFPSNTNIPGIPGFNGQ